MRLLDGSIKYNGHNGAEVKGWVNEAAEEGTTYFVTKGMAASTGQTWPYLRSLGGWGDDVRAAIFDEPTETWLPVRVGDTIVRENGIYMVVTR